MKKILLGLLLVIFAFGFISLSSVQADNEKTDKGPLSKITFIHYKKDKAEARIVPSATRDRTRTCYAYLASGAKWRTVKDFTINPTNSNLDSTFVTQAINSGVAEWEKYGGSAIFGNSILDLTVSNWGNNDGKNIVVFGPYADNNAIAVTTVWGYFGGDPSTREIVEWDMLLNNFYKWGDSTVNGASVIDLQDITTHELGHSAGLADLYTGSCFAQTMYGYSSYGDLVKRDLNTGDIQGIQKLYR